MLVEILQGTWVKADTVLGISPVCGEDGWFMEVLIENEDGYCSEPFEDRKTCVEICDETAQDINLALGASKQGKDHAWTKEDKPSHGVLDNLVL